VFLALTANDCTLQLLICNEARKMSSSSQRFCKLAFEHISALRPIPHNGSGGSGTALFLHGILGSKRNWRGPARECLKLLPGYDAVLVDHRGHGDSNTADVTSAHSVENCALDLLQLAKQQLQQSPPSNVLVAHSFGGKVALQYVQHCATQGVVAPQHVFVLDALPGAFDLHHDLRQSQSVSKVMGVLLQAPSQYASRNEAITYLTSRHIALAIAQWLATSLVPVEGTSSLRYCYDMKCVHELFENYAQTDMWGFLEDYTGHSYIHFVRAEKNSAWTADVQRRFESLRSERVSLDTMPNVGHWLHAENPQGLAQLIAAKVNNHVL
jgi:esterase